MAGMFKGDKGGVRPTDVGKSAKVLEPAGSGSRPTASRVEIPTSAPSDPRTLDRNPPSPLK